MSTRILWAPRLAFLISFSAVHSRKSERTTWVNFSSRVSRRTIAAMAHGQEVKKRTDAPVEIQERGEIFFFYRPKVNKEEAHSPDDVQRLYMVLHPESGEKPVEQKQCPDSGKEGAKHGLSPSSSHHDEDEPRLKEHPEGGHGAQEVNIEREPLLRLIILGRKSLPDPEEKSKPSWGFVDLVTTNLDDIKDALKEQEYDTATRGHRRRPRARARALGEGIYCILRHKYSDKRMHTHLIYKLELPPKDRQNEPQEVLNVEREGSFVIQIKNPEIPGGQRSYFAGVQSKRKAVYPAHLQGLFGNKRWHPADPPDFLNYEGCELLLISASDNIEEELDLELRPETEEPNPECLDLVKMFGPDVAPIKPLLEGTWT